MEEAHKHPWAARLGVALVMLGLAFIGMIVSDIHKSGAWLYWKWVIPVYAVLALWLSWYVRKKVSKITPITLWHELFHWAGLIAAVFMVSFFVEHGIISRFVAGLFDLTLLAFSLFLAGIYIETTFIFIGILLGIFALLVSFVVEYFYAFTVPLLIATILIVAITIWLSHKKISS